jgi:uncharacterized protein YidB (DUF937 family)
MGIFDSIAGQVAGALSNSQGGTGGAQLMGALSQLISNPQFGGLSGLMGAFQSKGVGDVVASWIGNGSNLPISMAQIQSALGDGPLQALAEKTGLSTDQMAANLSEHLPGLVDQLTPHGQLPEGDLMSQGLGLLQGFMNNKA